MDDYSKVFTGDAVLIRGCGRTDFQVNTMNIIYSIILYYSQILL